MRKYFLLILFGLFVLSTAGICENQENPFLVSTQNKDFEKNPKLLARITDSPHGYFRFINIPFSQYICREFRETYYDAPIFNLHGDAHIEQYAVTDLGRGLTDFDDSSTGPAILDLMRFGVSVYLACDQKGWSDSADAVFNEFLVGYDQSLSNPEQICAEPELVTQIRQSFTYDSLVYFNWIESIMKPIPEEELAVLEKASQPYKLAMQLKNPQFPATYFETVSAGYLQIGIGSALDEKYLLRCAGLTDNPYDDVVLEVKEVRDISAIPCLNSSGKNDPFRILVGQSRIAYQPFHHLGYFEFHGKTFWVHSWVQNFKEITIQNSFQNLNDLKAVVFDIGVQLGLGHPKQIAAPMDLQLRQAQLRWLKLYDKKIQITSKNLAKKVTKAWNIFKQNLDKTGNHEAEVK